MATVEVKVPDIGDFQDIPVIEVFVKPGDTLKKDDSIVTLESDKATMEVPASDTGTVKEVRVKLGDKVSEGTVLLVLRVQTLALVLPLSVPVLRLWQQGLWQQAPRHRFRAAEARRLRTPCRRA